MRVLTIATLLGLLLLLGCSPPGGGGPPTGAAVNVSGYWVPITSTAFYRFRQTGTEVTGEFYVTLDRVSLAYAESVWHCGILGGMAEGRTLTIEIILTADNCIRTAVGTESYLTVSGEVRGDQFKGVVTVVTYSVVGGVRRELESYSYATEWLNVDEDDPRVAFILD